MNTKKKMFFAAIALVSSVIGANTLSNWGRKSDSPEMANKKSASVKAAKSSMSPSVLKQAIAFQDNKIPDSMALPAKTSNDRGKVQFPEQAKLDALKEDAQQSIEDTRILTAEYNGLIDDGDVQAAAALLEGEIIPLIQERRALGEKITDLVARKIELSQG